MAKKGEQRKEKVRYEPDVTRVGLERYRGRKQTKHLCPSCGNNKRTYVKYVDKITGQYIGDEYGRCDRLGCYHKSPYGKEIPDTPLYCNANEVLPQFRDKDFTNTLDPRVLTQLTGEYFDNFSQWLLSNFDPVTVYKVLQRYWVGSCDKWGKPSTVFFQIDTDRSVRTGKIMSYHRLTGKRIKKPYDLISWLHIPYNGITDITDFALQQCFFGEHLLEKSDTFHVVESEKTAILCSIQNPKSYWLATGGLQNISEERLQPFIDKKLIFYPDKGKAFKEWERKLSQFTEEYQIKISKAVEKMDHLNEGDDIGDHIIHINKNKSNE